MQDLCPPPPIKGQRPGERESVCVCFPVSGQFWNRVWSQGFRLLILRAGRAAVKALIPEKAETGGLNFWVPGGGRDCASRFLGSDA